ncbi:MAG: class I SAM-dependent methyltransferase [Pseudomonadota bacterium]
MAKYDIIGLDYANLRRPDPRIAAQIHAALGDAKTIVNVGAGAGGYEPPDRAVTAVEPSQTMIDQRPATAAPAIQGNAENLPFPDDSFDAAMASLTIHHWTDHAKGLQEMRRVSRGPVVLFTFDPTPRDFWLWHYFPGLAALDAHIMPPMTFYESVLGPVDIHPIPIPADCTDGFLCAYWKRPAAYLDDKIRTGMSSFHAMDAVEAGLENLAHDLETGTWEQQNADLLNKNALDMGYRLVISR